MPGARRILFVCHYLHHVVGGAEIIGHRVVGFLRAAGWEVETVVLPGPRPAAADAVHEWNLPAGLRPESSRGKQLAVYAGGLGLDARAVRQCFRRCEGRRFDRVVAHDTVSAGVARGLARRLGLPFASFVYEPLPRAVPDAPGIAGWIGGWLTGRANRAMRRTLAESRVCIAASRDTGERFRAFVPGVPVEVVYNSVERPSTPPGPGEGLLYVGRMSREKGFDLLAEAYASLTDPPRLSIAGLDGPLAHEGRALAARFPQVRLLPPVRPDQMAAVYAAQAVVVAPSVWPDPLPGAVLEARAQQRALIVSDRGGIPEIVAGYRRVRKVDVGRSRREVVGELARAMAEMGTWASVPADVMEEEAFYARHSSQTHARRVVEVLEGVMR